MDLRYDITSLLSKYKGFIFDFDKTIVSLHVDWDDLKSSLLQTFELKEKQPLNIMLQEIYRTKGDVALEKAYTVVGQYENAYPEAAEYNEYCIRWIQQAADQGKKLGIFSNNMHSTIAYFLQRRGIYDLFSMISAKDTVKQYKPNPEGLLTILSHWGLPKDAVLYIGNEEVDTIAGDSAGIETFII